MLHEMQNHLLEEQTKLNPVGLTSEQSYTRMGFIYKELRTPNSSEIGDYPNKRH